jgi:hypothetical protein
LVGHVQSKRPLVVFDRDVLILQGTVEGFVRWQLTDVQFVQRGDSLVWEEPLLFCTLVGFQVLTVTKTRSQVVGDVKKLQLLCLDTHEIVVPFHGMLDLVTVHQSSKKFHLHGIHVVFPFIETNHGEFLKVVFQLLFLFLRFLCAFPSLGLVSVEFLQIPFHTLAPVSEKLFR